MRNLLALLLLVPSLCLAQDPSSVPADGLVAYYSLDEGSLGDSGLTPSQPAEWTTNRNGETNMASWFGGSQEYVTTGLNYQDFTISAWVLPDGANSNLDICHGIVSQNADNCNALVFMATCNIPLAANFQVREQDDCAAEQVSTGLEHNMWQHLVFVREGGQIQSYRNGILEQSGPGTSTALSPDVPLRIGSMPYGGLFRGFEGGIDDVGIWNRALTEEEVLTLYNAELPLPGCTDPVACNYDPAATEDDGSCIFPPSVDLGPDTITCEDIIILDAGEGFASYLWSTGETTQSIEAHLSGEYVVTVESAASNINSFAMEFDGEDDLIQTGIAASELIGLEALTIATRFKWMGDDLNGGPQEQGILSNAKSGSSQLDFGIDYEWPGGDRRMHLAWADVSTLGSNAMQHSLLDAIAIQPGVWYDVVVTLSADAVTWYLDGVLVEQDAVVFAELGQESNPVPNLRIGKANEIYDTHFGGVLDDLQLYTRALTAEEAQGLYACGVAHDSTGLFGHWSFEEGVGSITLDDSPAGNNGDIVGAQFTSDTPDSPCPGCLASDTLEVALHHGSCFCGEGTEWDEDTQQCLAVVSGPTPSCGEGTVWDPVNEECIIAIPADLNYDGCVSVNDLLVLLAVHGTCPPYPEWPDEPIDTTWACGDPVTYWDYDYATVLIGDQCWFAENLRSEQYADGNPIPLVEENEAWTQLLTGARCSYMNSEATFSTFGGLYNWYAVSSESSICPTGWRVPDAFDISQLATQLGGYPLAGIEMKSDTCCGSSWQGTNLSGFNALPGGWRNDNGTFGWVDIYAEFWESSSTLDNSGNPDRYFLYKTYDALFNDGLPANHGCSVRCIKDQ